MSACKNDGPTYDPFMVSRRQTHKDFGPFPLVVDAFSPVATAAEISHPRIC